MPKYSINSETLEEIAQAIRVKKAATSQNTNEKNNEPITPLEMPEQILTIGQSTYTALLQEKRVNPSLETQEITANNGYDGLSKVTVFAVPTEEWTFIMEDDSTIIKKVAVME